MTGTVIGSPPPSSPSAPDDPAPAAGGHRPEGFTALHADAVRLLQRWDAPDLALDFKAQAFLDLLGAGPDAVWKHGLSCHLTASAIVLDPTGTQVLLTLHRKARAWFQFGGHLEPGDQDLRAGATREAREESGVPGLLLEPGIADLSIHDLPAAFGHCRTHFDVRFAGVLSPEVDHAVSAESLDVRWWPAEDLPRDASPDLPAVIRAGRRHLGLP